MSDKKHIYAAKAAKTVKSDKNHFFVLKIENTASIPMRVCVTDPEGTKHSVVTLAAGESTHQFTSIGCEWSLMLDEPEPEISSGDKSGN